MEEIRNGRTFYEWFMELCAVLHKRFSRSKNIESAVENALKNQPLEDYWLSDYEPKDAAKEL